MDTLVTIILADALICLSLPPLPIRLRCVCLHVDSGGPLALSPNGGPLLWEMVLALLS